MEKKKIMTSFGMALLAFSLVSSICFNVIAGPENANDEGPDLQTVTNYIFWSSYTYDHKQAPIIAMNGIPGMSDHGFTHELFNGDSISLYIGYLPVDNAKESFYESVAGCQRISGIGIFKQLYQCKDKIEGCVIRTMPIRSKAEYIITYRKGKNADAWDWDTLKLMLQTFRFIDGDEFIGLYQAMYPHISIEKYRVKPEPGDIEVW